MLDQVIIKYGKFLLILGIVFQLFLRYKGIEHFPFYHYGMFSEKIEIQQIKGIVIAQNNQFESIKKHVKSNYNICEQQLLHATTDSLKIKAIQFSFSHPETIQNKLFYVVIFENQQLNYLPYLSE
jgi:hypothetical protein